MASLQRFPLTSLGFPALNVAFLALFGSNTPKLNWFSAQQCK
jgi:hypothetical protein